MEFKSFPKIERIGKLFMTITQKLNGSNAQICIEKDDSGEFHIQAGSRTRWITPEDDNFGFARYVEENKESIIELLGPGRHYGEWVGPGINSSEGLTEKCFVLFDFWKYPEGRPLPPRMLTIPILYQGPVDMSKIVDVMEDLKTNGSKLVPGFMRPEGVVITIAGTRFKKVFEPEETKWAGTPKDKNKAPKTPQPDVSHLLQPIRLEKILSRDEKYIRDYPHSLKNIARTYVEDLEQESQLPEDKDDYKAVKKALGSRLFPFIKSMVESNVSYD